MACNSSFGCSPQPQGCPDEFGCTGACPDFVIRRHDTKPAFKVLMEDCDGPMDLTGLVVEASMWAKGKLKSALTIEDNYFSLADNIGFNQIMIGDIIIMDQIRLPEHMLVVGFDENDRLVEVQRGYHGTAIQKYKRGTPFKIMKFMNAVAQTEMIYQDVLEINGTTTSDVLMDSFFVYEWGPNDTCLPGCYYMEFKLIKLTDTIIPPVVDTDVNDSDNDDDDNNTKIVVSPSVITHDVTPIDIPDVSPFPNSFIDSDGASVIPTFTSPSLTPTDFGCGLANGVEWMRRFPVAEEGFLIQIINTPTAE
jgi:hypothetical protein